MRRQRLPDALMGMGGRRRVSARRCRMRKWTVQCPSPLVVANPDESQCSLPKITTPNPPHAVQRCVAEERSPSPGHRLGP